MSDRSKDTARPTETAFPGFSRPDANYVYCPNQFFDICLKIKSRGVIRIVSYVIRQTLGWLDENGQPVSQDISVSYSDLIKKAGVSHGAIADSLRKAQALGFLKTTREGIRHARGTKGQGAEFRLNWDQTGYYAKSIEEFKGFFTGEGNRSPIPNDFFDHVIPNETLAVTKVVATVIRHTICYQNQFGGRRSESPLSCTFIQRYTNIKKREAVVDALRYSVDAGYIEKVTDGVFSSDTSRQEAAVYAIRWQRQANNQNNWPKRELGKSSSIQAANKGTSKPPKREPVNVAKKVTSLEKTLINKTSKQQAAADSEKNAIMKLMEVGFRSSDAIKLVGDRGVEVVQNQLTWLDAREARNPVALLRKAISENWEMPEKYRLKERSEKIRRIEQQKHQQIDREDQQALTRKKMQSKRREPLMKIWEQASRTQRLELIGRAATRQTSQSISDFILKKGAAIDTPPTQVLDEIAIQYSLPTVSETT